jgi:hypothetical protein
MSESPKFCYSRKTDVPPKGWIVKCPIVNEEVYGGDFGDMVSNCEKLLVSKGITPPVDLVSQIENNLCDRLAGHPNCIPCTKAQQTLGFSEIVRWVRAMYQFAVNVKGLRGCYHKLQEPKPPHMTSNSRLAGSVVATML